MEILAGLENSLDKSSVQFEDSQELLAQKVSSLNDEVAKKTPCIPFASGGSNFLTCSLKEDNEGNYYFVGIRIYSIFFGFHFLCE